MKIAIHQPEHLPWLGFFNKMLLADAYVILDNVQFRKNYFQHRNKFYSQKKGVFWLGVPLKKGKLTDLIKEKEVSGTEKNWEKYYLNGLKSSYIEARYFENFFFEFESIISSSKNLVELNMEMISLIRKALDINIPIYLASDLINNFKDNIDVTLQICLALGVDTYISGAYGKNYLNISEFMKNKISVLFQEIQHNELKLAYSDVPLSSLHYLMTYGPEYTRNLVQKCGRIK